MSVRSLLAARLDEARAAWPGVAVDGEAFLDWLSPRVADDDAPKVHVGDLYLAYACARHDAAALAAFEARYAGDVRAACQRFSDLPGGADEIGQRVRERLFVEEPPAILGYAGQGSLASWLRVVVTRTLINVRGRESRERPRSSDFFEAIVASDDGAEALYLKRAFGAELKSALLEALEALTNREKSLLRYAYCDEKNADEIGAVFRVHRATAARWVCKARERLVEETRARLVSRLGATPSEIKSIVRLGAGAIDTTIVKHLVPSS
jgi:RNA polymerase sigma-70 factor (ECF subfamily)